MSGWDNWEVKQKLYAAASHGAPELWRCRSVPVGVSQGPAIRHSKNKLLFPLEVGGFCHLKLVISALQTWQGFRDAIWKLPAGRCWRRQRDFPACPMGKAWESINHLQQLQLTQVPQRGTGGWRSQLWGQRGHEMIHQGHFGLLEEVEGLLGGQAGTGRSSGEHQQVGWRREQQQTEENHLGDRWIRFRREDKRQQGLSHTPWLRCQESALWTSQLCIPPRSASMTPPALLQAGRERSCQWAVLYNCWAVIAVPFPVWCCWAWPSTPNPSWLKRVTAVAGDFERKWLENPLIFQKKTISDVRYGPIPQTDTPIISLHTSVDKNWRSRGTSGRRARTARQMGPNQHGSELSAVLETRLSLRPFWTATPFIFPPYELFAPNASFFSSLAIFWQFSFTSPVCDGLAPIYSCNRLICEEGPVIREVPESTMASQPWEQNATRPWIFMLRMKNKTSLSKWCIHHDCSNALVLAKVLEHSLKLKRAAKLSQS